MGVGLGLLIQLQFVHVVWLREYASVYSVAMVMLSVPHLFPCWHKVGPSLSVFTHWYLKLLLLPFI